jgi:hypothetical protein
LIWKSGFGAKTALQLVVLDTTFTALRQICQRCNKWA